MLLRFVQAKVAFLGKMRDKGAGAPVLGKLEQDLVKTLSDKLPAYKLGGTEAAEIIDCLGDTLQNCDETVMQCMDLLTSHTEVASGIEPDQGKTEIFDAKAIVSSSTNQSCLHFCNYPTKHEVDCLKDPRILDANKIILLTLLCCDIGLLNPSEKTKQAIIGFYFACQPVAASNVAVGRGCSGRAKLMEFNNQLQAQRKQAKYVGGYSCYKIYPADPKDMSKEIYDRHYIDGTPDTEPGYMAGMTGGALNSSFVQLVTAQCPCRKSHASCKDEEQSGSGGGLMQQLVSHMSQQMLQSQGSMLQLTDGSDQIQRKLPILCLQNKSPRAQGPEAALSDSSLGNTSPLVAEAESQLADSQASQMSTPGSASAQPLRPVAKSLALKAAKVPPGQTKSDLAGAGTTLAVLAPRKPSLPLASDLQEMGQSIEKIISKAGGPVGSKETKDGGFVPESTAAGGKGASTKSQKKTNKSRATKTDHPGDQVQTGDTPAEATGAASASKAAKPGSYMTGPLVTAEEATTCSYSAFHSRAYDRCFKRARALGEDEETARKKARNLSAMAKQLWKEKNPGK